MRNRIVQSVVLAAALFLVAAIPAAAADGNAASVGLTFANKSIGVGVDADYSRVFRDMGMDRSMGWLVEGSFNHKGFGGFGTDFSVNTLMVQAGVRVTGKAGDTATWHVQGSAGIVRANASIDNLTQSLCDLAGVDCSTSSTDFVITPAGAYTYWFSPKHGVKAQVNIPIDVSNSDSFIRVDVNFVMKLGR